MAGIPFVGYLLDRRTTFDVSLVVLASGVAYGALGLLPHVGPQLASIAIFVFLRPLMYTFGKSFHGRPIGGVECLERSPLLNLILPNTVGDYCGK